MRRIDRRTMLAAAWAALACVASPFARAQGGDLEQLMSLLAQRKHGHVTFVEEHFLKMLERPLESSGELLYEAPDHLEKRTLKPKPETLILDHGVLTAHRGRRTYVLELRDYPQVVPLVDSIRAALAGDLPALRQMFKVGFDGTLEHWKLQLAPADAAIASSLRQIRIEGARDQIQSVEIQQTDGDRSLLTIGPEVRE